MRGKKYIYPIKSLLRFPKAICHLNLGGRKSCGAETIEYVILANGAISCNVFTMDFYSFSRKHSASSF